MSRVSISILTGRRLPLLRRTIDSLRSAVPSLLDEAYVVIYLNGHDDITDDYIRALTFVDDYIYIPSTCPEPIGAAVSRIALHVRGRSSYHLHLEDDWTCSGSSPNFLAKAKAILDSHPNVGQVRLRSRLERVMTTHMVTGYPFRWIRSSDKTLISKLHFTFNPSLIRTSDLDAIYPAASEIEAAQNYNSIFSHVAQLDPGVFFHTGGSESLRQSLGR